MLSDAQLIQFATDGYLVVPGVVDETLLLATDAEIELIVDYLTTHLGKLNINKAPADKIAADLKVPKETAEAIVAYREKNGPFKLWDDIGKVQGVDLKKIQDKKGLIEF